MLTGANSTRGFIIILLFSSPLSINPAQIIIYAAQEVEQQILDTNDKNQSGFQPP
jgi:hypothetical protein